MPQKRILVTVEITPEVRAVIAAQRRLTGRTQKDLLSTAITKLASWDDSVQTLFWDSVPPTIRDSDDFWALVERKLMEGARSCRAKYRKAT